MAIMGWPLYDSQSKLAMLNPIQLLKLSLLAHGMRLTQEAVDALRQDWGTRPLTLADYPSTSGVTLVLEGDCWVNVPVSEHNPNFVTAAPHLLEYADGLFYIIWQGKRIFTRPVPVPRYADWLDADGMPFYRYVVTHTDRIRLSPIEGCACDCRFCDMPFKYTYRTKSIERMIEVTRVALADPDLPAQHMLISGGTPHTDDYGYLHHVYASIINAFPGFEVDIMMLPLPGLLDISKLQAIGLHGLAINMEVYNEELARCLMPRKAQVTRAQYLKVIGNAVEHFGPGRVRSLLMVGLEPIDDTLRGVKALAERGCEPVLSPFRPSMATPLHDWAPPTVKVMTETYLRAHDIVESLGVKLGPRCVPCQHNTIAFPDDSGYYTQEHTHASLDAHI